MKPARWPWTAVALVSSAIAVSSRASAAPGDGERADLPARLADNDPSDGRLDGDINTGLGLGATFGPHSPRGAIDLRLRYLETVGLFATYEDALGDASVVPERLVAGGLELRPLFLARWGTGKEWGVRRADLLLDSFGLEIGGFVDPSGAAGLRRYAGLQAGLGVEAPILASADGPWIALHAGLRWEGEAMTGIPTDTPPGRAGFLTITLSLHHVFAAHLVDWRDRAP
jgi:hypothetical protein